MTGEGLQRGPMKTLSKGYFMAFRAPLGREEWTERDTLDKLELRSRHSDLVSLTGQHALRSGGAMKRLPFPFSTQILAT